MLLNIDQIRAVTQGAESVAWENGYFRFCRYTPEEAAVLDPAIVVRPAGVRLEFRTDAAALELKGRSFDTEETIRSYFCVDVFVDGKLTGCIRNLPEEDCVGNYAEKRYPLGDFEEEIRLPEGTVTVRVQLPHSAGVEFSQIRLEGASFLEPVKKEKVLLAYGDSITQGYDAAHASGTYIVRTAQALGMELFNKGVGGMQFSPKFAAIPNPRKADLLLVAYGTNDWSHQTRENLGRNAEDMLRTLRERHPGVPMFVLSPIWRLDYEAEKPFGPFLGIRDLLEEICGNIPDAHLISGMELVPHDKNYFGDLWLHPNDEGCRYYAQGVVDHIRKIMKER